MLIALLLVPGAPVQRVAVFGFDDFCYDEICYDNPARELALRFCGAVVAVEWEAVEALRIPGPGVGIGVDPCAAWAYVNGSALGLRSRAAAGPDAGEYECGHLYGRLLERDRCSVFVHVPAVPSARDVALVREAIGRVEMCVRGRVWEYGGVDGQEEAAAF